MCFLESPARDDVIKRLIRGVLRATARPELSMGAAKTLVGLLPAYGCFRYWHAARADRGTPSQDRPGGPAARRQPQPPRQASSAKRMTRRLN
jgi:hypothetical protein